MIGLVELRGYGQGLDPAPFVRQPRVQLLANSSLAD